jgi:hypothetical protein
VADISPAIKLVAVTPSDSVNIAGTGVPVTFRGLYVGVAGNVAVVPSDGGTVVTLVGVAAGVVHPISFIRINATNTTATSIVACQ